MVSDTTIHRARTLIGEQISPEPVVPDASLFA